MSTWRIQLAAGLTTMFGITIGWFQPPLIATFAMGVAIGAVHRIVLEPLARAYDNERADR